MKYRKKPIVIEAEQWLNTDYQYKTLLKSGIIKNGTYGESGDDCIISTLEGDMICNYKDWIIKGIKGEYYPCKPDIFEATYEKVD